MNKDANYGRVLANRYQLGNMIGKGAMGRVYQANDLLLGGVGVAVKFLSQTILNQKTRDRFETEAKICALLGEQSINIVRVRDYGVDEMEIPFYVMEYLQGDNLRELVKRCPLTLPRFFSLTRQICLGLQCAHQGIVIDGQLCPVIHRDIKPSNILVIEDLSLGELVKVLDFGIAKLQSEQDATSSFKGTLAYCSPEQMEGKELDNRSDIYSLGVLLFEMLTGEIPLRPETHSFASWYQVHHHQQPKSLASLRPDLKIPKSIENLIYSCLAKSASDRPSSVSTIINILENEQFSLRNSAVTQPPPVESIVAEPLPELEDIIGDLSLDSFCQTLPWPKNKPQAEIVFSHLLSTPEGVIPTLWVMLSEKEAEKRQQDKRYNHFLFLMSPHPMLLWITALYHYQRGPRWLPCYLDLKSPTNQKLLQAIAETGSYRLLFFSLEKPEICAHVMTINISPAQCPLLKEWVNAGKTLVSVAHPKMSKNLLKQEFEKLKSQILAKLQLS
ncbi:serine/threonine protein kinase [Merismopedia glauca]|uniref:Serine/threonine protein kinase n=1 Tax=Merismopedia glauca CCAP 1448/3 TaxID=1296344 RepID=A0A2T1C9S5_9CYAN|nr:serine/threonine-protein kinase [Merismopedia glauca]PSB05006.1 serine/threonine protein kinase [Merismopedia glauca CCAP 1448/3]